MFNFMTTFSVLAMVSLAAAGPINNGTIGPSADIGCTTSTIMQTQLNGNGNPHQNFVYKQVSGTTDCTNNPSGSATVTQSETVGWSVSISGAADFITGGFQVSASTTTGFSNSFGCATNGGTQSGSLCVFERIQLTAYTVNSRTCIENSCTGATCGGWGENVVIYAPNSNQGSCFYDNFQLNLPCLGLGSEQYVYNGPAGGPQYISC
jgi:hypothetical protein